MPEPKPKRKSGPRKVGQPLKYREPVERTTASLPPYRNDKIRELGGGVYSRGLNIIYVYYFPEDIEDGDLPLPIRTGE